MMRKNSPRQPLLSGLDLPFEVSLDRKNRWVLLGDSLPWHRFEKDYLKHFHLEKGGPKPLSVRVALGSLILKEAYGFSDETLVEQIQMNPYFQYFIGFENYQSEQPFASSMMTFFRQRFDQETLSQVNELSVASFVAKLEESAAKASDSSEENRGKLVVDATCVPADITYPTDVKLLNKCREVTEEVIDRLYEPIKRDHDKPRTYRKVARKEWLNFSRSKRLSSEKRQEALKGQLSYVKRNLRHIDDLIHKSSLSLLPQALYKKLLVVSEVRRQQEEMHENQTHSIPGRIVNLTQPHVRPIVRGKEKASCEFGAKISISVDERGFCYLDHFSFDNFNESTLLIDQVEAFKKRTGHYPASVHADQIYRTRSNRKYCQDKNIRLSGPPLGRPKKEEDPQQRKKNKKIAKQDEADRNIVEGKFGEAKRRFQMGRLMARRVDSSLCMVTITLLTINCFKFLRAWGLFLRLFFQKDHFRTPYRAYQSTQKPYTRFIQETQTRLFKQSSKVSASLWINKRLLTSY